MTTKQGYCNTCKKYVSSLHKCPECGKYVFVEPGDLKLLEQELRKKKAEIRSAARAEVKRQNLDEKKEEDREKISEIMGKAEQEIAKLIEPGVNK